MSDPHDFTAQDLASRTGLPPEMQYLRDAFPRTRWADRPLPETAAFWLQMHAGFRQASAEMQASVARYRDGTIDVRTFHNQTLPTLAQFLQHLDGHHRIETDHYFPRFRRIEPRIAPGIDLLDRDHNAVHAHLETLAAHGNALHQAVRSSVNACDLALTLADTFDTAAPPLLRHLDDEEDIVIPLIVLR